MVYYKYLFHNMRELSPNEGLVYSTLLSHSLMESENFLLDGTFSNDRAKLFAEDNGGYIDYQPLSTRQIMNRTDFSFPTVKKIVENLKDKHIIGKDFILCPPELLDGGYLKVPKGTKLKGQQLLFYSYIIDLCSRYGGATDKWAYRMKEDCNLTSEDNVYFIIKQLKEKGFLERLSDRRLKIK